MERREIYYTKKAHLLYDTLTPKDIGSPKSRTRRVRKQPTLYDPQTCSASEWTDSKKRLADSRNNMDENDNNNTMSKTSENEKCCEVRKVKNGASALIKYTDTNTSRTANITSAKSNPSALWCYYCKDSNIVCLFCACRVCYSKHDEKNILICDSCDEEYHIYCLDPPLTTVPKDKWFCPTCKKSDECSKDVKKVESEEPTIKVKPSPPAGTLPLKRSTRKLSQQVKCTNSEQQKHPTNERLKSNDDETDEISLSKLFRDSSKLKKDGNEKKRKAPTSPNTQKEKKLQRPSSSHSTPPLQKSRSGRTVKPQIFFDEMAEREQDQLLKSNHTQKSNSDEQQHQKKKKKSIATSPRPADAPRRGRPPKNLKPLQSDRMVTTTVGAPKQQTLTHAKSSAQIPIKPTDGASSAQDNKTSSLSGAISGSRKIPTPSTSKPSSSSIIKEDTPLVHDVPGKNVVQKPVDLNNNNVSHQTPAASRPQITTVTSPESNGIPVPDHNSHINPVHTNVSTPQAEHYSTPTKDPPISMATISTPKSESSTPGQQIGKIPRRKPGARECMQISRRWGVQVISPKYMDTLLNYCTRGKVEHLIRMRERLDEHSLMLESQLSGLQALIAEHGGADIELFGDRNLNGEGSLSSEFTVTPVSNIHENVTHENSNGSSVATNPQAQAQITSESQRLTPSHPHSQP